MKTYLLHSLMALLPLCMVASVNNHPEIRLTNAKDTVVPTKLRASILEMAELSLNCSDEAFLSAMQKVKDPYTNGNVSSGMVGESTSEKPLVVYDDASVLELIMSNFASQVRGTLAKGGNNYLQLKGGGMLQEGDSFPVQIPQIEGQTFTVSIMEITTRGYTLKMNDAVQNVTFEKASGIIKNSTK